MTASFSTAPESHPGGQRAGRLLTTCFLAAAVLLLSACGTRSLSRAPVEDRGAGMGRAPVGAVDPAGVKQLPGFENAGKPGYYTVKPGDTLIRIGLDTGQNWRDIGRWSNLENPNLIEVGQVLRVTPPVESSVAVSRPVTSGSVTPTAPTSASSAPATASASAAKPAASAPASASGGEDDVAWIWPAQGPVLAGFDEAKNKGMDIAGKTGDPVMASADGRVVYAGAGLRGYGNLIILKHNNTFLTAYAHNQTLLVKEDQSVRKGQKIAEMGASDTDRVKLHFEIRKQGKPVDPAKFLPAK
ncbi:MULTISPECIES: peptidoglycan DD-metalloendopeptidase family protein [unclassified Polaromonas]|uniref:peptidoglycan DD-metalloendopeptidase family protein n=1 Tax=unclassified Polaromonas TaxID=2638319 RepID=UPI000BDC6A65|nr:MULTISPECIES: peptidoglycan DD-metalloendopeptidase family protein [unclassified Polaromonas]OYY39382.1 MAG: peptidase [Polaromonas sp. 35-63-35]OYZ22121.1 MAG: peptidase [Polaromonas sp. 16-63-31]OYZ80686.1 MAG: peptidase [Polaromonas sp. 24-63-21]OZA51764.1 MAG: peptidase [Polaromonas sp. 17-63-33]OZA90288.1 MAG: peptidase [Polaromonas sp. 39-63-25]